MRNTASLFAPTSTLECALRKKCVPCCYKLLVHGTPDMEPNQRPELCPRSALEVRPSPVLLTPTMGTLVVQDPALSFAWAIRSHVASLHVMLAEAKATIFKTHPETSKRVKKLDNKVHFESAIADVGDFGTFDCVVWNFPKVDDAEAFFEHVRITDESGQIHISCPLGQSADFIAAAASAGFKHLGTLVFDRCSFPGYKVSLECETLVFATSASKTEVFDSSMAADNCGTWTPEHWTAAPTVVPVTPTVLASVEALLCDKSNFPKKEKPVKKTKTEDDSEILSKLSKKKAAQKKKRDENDEDEVDYVEMYNLKPKGKKHKVLRKLDYESNQEGKLRPTKRKLPVRMENGRAKMGW
ncbi:hypothetical protein SPRG_11266 [Saprolegnia parasitica CBS 223.65]|uniref:25S rRNA (uridine-N(3))-methyltransferase BMT5-like domain-containing protein n=1 Tax=Saprolegnia parasitica (strain CBS 223.65) TaxID=695850 RepID=A0A067BZ87_SAPPC|nr:hypothetical protein SPRG_11266 [Saprolegnia parasitica CBS 223.65]KDO23834.1 hypothetical protein SPRG_11266 [Saprolegnia parasitica CBS 223.65]|eukprot:XP_012205467.1 hypothetical protein SPRG_11266 [Saprolegnia parasitica CBS 223.65]